MKTVIKGLIEYQGMSECIPLDLDNFTQMVIDEESCIPDEKPNIDNILKVYAETDITNARIVKTPRGISLEGVKLTGYKLIIEGGIKTKIQYIASECTQSVHSVHFYIPFVSSIILPEDFTPMSIITTSAFIEDIFAQKANCRCIYENISILLTAEIC